MANVLSQKDSVFYLEQKKIAIGQWNELKPLVSVNKVQSDFCTGKSVYELINFSRHVAGWMAKGQWKILQIDNSSCFYECDWALFCALILGPQQKHIDLLENRAFLFEFGLGEGQDFRTEILISHIIFWMIVQEAHCHLVSSGGSEGEMISIQDGVVYFYSNGGHLEDAKFLLNNLKNNPMQPANWVYENEI